MGAQQTTLYHGDCLDIMPTLEAASVDAILTDLPYGTTACAWDEIIPFEPMWAQVKRVLKPRGVFVTTASQPFTSKLVMSNLKWFKYEWIWDKKIPSGMSYAKFQPMRQHENILVFSSGKTIYNPQKILRDKPIRGGGMSKGETTNNQKLVALKKLYLYKNPTTMLNFSKIRRGSIHPTQKPVELYEYLINTYTDIGDTILDIAMGSGTTGVACVNTNRNFIGIELDLKYFEIVQKRIADAKQQTHLFY